MTAGEWNDIDNWAFWLDLQANDTIGGYRDYWQCYPNQCYAVRLTDAAGQPAVDALLELRSPEGQLLWQARTDNKGKAELWAGLFGGQTSVGSLSASKGGFTAQTTTPIAFPTGVNTLTLNGSPAQSGNIDVAFVVDATGSMGDEITYLQAELTDVLQRVQALNGGQQLRAGAVFYRDENDAYLTRVQPFTTNFGQVNTFVNNQSAGGGGDFPEAVDEALAVAVGQLEWSSNARARVMFLILDAPPHKDDDKLTKMRSAITDAARRGIRVIPVTASGINQETEFLMRYVALATSATYVFITNHSGIGAPHLEPTVGEYEVEYLNDLMVRLVKKYSE